MSKVTVTFLIDREEKRVVCAEAGSDFVDVLFSFLTLPLGSIVRLLGKQSGWGSLDSLCQSVEQLDIKHFQTDACKKMLLNPRSAAALTCEDLKVKNIFAGNPRMSYYCEETLSLIQSVSQTVFQQERTCRCHRCGKLMNKCCFHMNKISECGGIFVNERVNFLITDNLRVIPASLKGGCSLFKELQITDSSIMEKKLIHFGTEEYTELVEKAISIQESIDRDLLP
ncbi:uncharacterized protein LOC110022803 [Phalaenopsis equestris]|uniref:uncharacterized protein LOC110022803 n=1 Tax=Phalaenopsis equestris TaxID=78828 RepID=UPI0009E52D7B|nr:uncharacterized protein LOC110022803 [Phalaenopsis equestris]